MVTQTKEQQEHAESPKGDGIDRLPTYRELIDAAVARQPKTCPACGSADIVPTFMEPDDWECLNETCLAVWRQDR